MLIQGTATPEGTESYAARYAGLQFQLLGRTNLASSHAGFGCYRIDAAEDAHRSALTLALQKGINLIDTSANYADGGSETLVGEVLQALIGAEKLYREQVVVISKAGYIQGSNYQMAQQRKEAGRPFPNVVKIQAGLEHCIHPEFLADQLTRTLERLNLTTLDVFLLHNPEYYLKWAHAAHIPLTDARREYERRIRQAFSHLEEEVQNGRIACYGISSNTFPAATNDPEFTSLEAVLKIARQVSTDHHFRVIQLPMNLYETGAVTELNMPDGRSTLAYAHDHALGVLVNRPLNAIRQQALVRLADVLPPSYPATPAEVSTAVDSSVKAEETFKRDLLPQLEIDAETRQQLLQYLAIGVTLQGHWASFYTFQNWRDVQGQFLLPRAQAAVQFLSNLENSPAALREWLDGYVEAVNTTLAAVAAFYQEIGHKESQGIQATAVLTDADWQADTLSQTAVRALRSTAGISCVLVGMRQEHYVADVLADLQRPVEVKDRHKSWQALRDALPRAT